jgi:hypothetical protein
MTIYISETTLFYHHLRAAHSVSVAHPSNKSSSGIIPNWANGVRVAAANALPLTTTASSSSVTGFPLKSTSSRTTNSNHTNYPIQPDGLELDDESDILANLVPDYMAQVSSQASSPKNVSFLHDQLLSLRFRNCTGTLET